MLPTKPKTSNFLILFAIIFLMSTSYVISQETYLDNFNTTSYSNNNGSSNFSVGWDEDNDGDSPSNGNIRITGNELRFDDLDNNDRISRALNLNGAIAVTLTLDYDADDRGNEGLNVQLWNNTSSSWETIASISSTNTGSISHTLTPNQISNNSEIRFISNSNGWNNNERIYIDNVLFTATFAPSIVVNDVNVIEDSGLAIFTITHNGPNTAGSYTVNYAITSVTATEGVDYTTSSGAYTGTLTFNGTSGDAEQISILITDDTILEPTENFTIQFTSVSNASVSISDTATGSIIDNDSIIMSNGTTSNECDTVFLDAGGLGDYSNNLNLTHTLCPDVGSDYVSVDFTSFDVEAGFDFLYIYDGTTTGAPLIGQYDNNNVPTTIAASAGGSGCLTFRFTSDGSETGTGFQADIKCYQEGPRLVIDDVSVDEDAGIAVFTVTSTRAAHGRNIFLFGFVNTQFTVNYTTTNGSALAGSDYTATTGTLTFSGAIGNQRTISVPITDDGVPELDENFFVEFTGVTAPDAQVNFDDIGVGTINSQILANVPLTLFKQFDGDYDYTTTGGSLRTQSNGTNACAIQTTSTNSLVAPIPNTGTIEAAYLYWAHSSYIRDEQVTFEGQTVNASFVYQTTFNASGTNLSFYGYVSDVTTLVNGVTNINTNNFDFSGLSIDTSSNFCGTATVLGGWSLIVFYKEPTLPAVNINLYQGFDGLQNSGTSFTLDSFFAIAGAGAKATFLSWEGDATLDGNTGTNPEALSITNQANTNFNLTGDGGNPGNNAYNSSIYDNVVAPVYNTPNIYGVDLDTYDISTFITPGDTQVTANVDVGQDYVINNAVVIKVPSNLITGTVFEDINYPGGNGRDQVTSSGAPVSGAIVELFESNGTFIERKNTNVNGDYSFAGMEDGDYLVKVVNSSVRSSRGNGLNCTACFPIQTYRNFGNANLLTDVTSEIGGANPSATQDAALGILTDAQSVSQVTVASNGVVGLDFGFNFNTIVNTNENGQGSLEQFIVNSNNLDETGLDIEANSIFDPTAGDDTSIFMIPPAGDPLGRTADANFATGYFDIIIPNENPLSDITDSNTNIDGRTQTSYSGDSNAATTGSGGTNVGTTGNPLPNYERPEIQVYRPDGDVLKVQGDNTTIRNLAVNANNNAGIRIQSGSATVSNNLIGVNALGNATGNINSGIEITGGTSIIDGNYISDNTDQGIWVNGGTSTLIQNNEITINGNGACNDNIRIQNGSGIIVTQNLISNAASFGIEIETSSGGIVISENTIIDSGQNGNDCVSAPENAGIMIIGDGSLITNNIIATSAGAGIILGGGNSTGNLISQNSIYANGTDSPALGIDIASSGTFGDGITLNDSGDTDNGPNGSLNFPVITSSYVGGGVLTVRGWARPGATIEWFLTDINEGTASTGDNQLGLSTDYGEGQIYLGTSVEGSASDLDTTSSPYTDVDGNTDTTNNFHFVITIPPGVQANDLITSTATIGNSTSEFSPFSIVKIPTLITNRRITYRVKKD